MATPTSNENPPTPAPQSRTARPPASRRPAVDVSLAVTEKRIRRGLVLVLVGLAIQFGASLYWTPGTFIISAALGVPAVLLGTALFAHAVWRAANRDLGGGRDGET